MSKKASVSKASTKGADRKRQSGKVSSPDNLVASKNKKKLQIDAYDYSKKFVLWDDLQLKNNLAERPSTCANKNYSNTFKPPKQQNVNNREFAQTKKEKVWHMSLSSDIGLNSFKNLVGKRHFKRVGHH